MTSRKEKPIIEVKHLSKEYRIGMDRTYKRFSESVTNAVRHPVRTLRGLTGPKETFWALKDINFEVERGEVLGIIGRNGAGKSTLLKILSRITYPTEGEVVMRGRVGSLLEVGTGFHPELTGRENIYFNGAILGMKKREIEEKFEEIVKFSGVEKFLDTPVKRYSSGMNVRLAFSVAAHLDPEILLVDEVLAVGDAEFQKKCLGKMGEVASEGRTVLFVSHNMGAVRRLCHRGILLSDGQIVYRGTIEDTVDRYISGVSTSVTRRATYNIDPKKPISILEVTVDSPDKCNDEALDISDPIVLKIKYHVKDDITGTNISVALCQDGMVLFRTWDIDDNINLFRLRKAGDYLANIYIPQDILNSGIYTVYVAAGQPGIGAIVQYSDCLIFELENLKSDLSQKSYSRGGIFRLPIKWETHCIDRVW